MPATPSSAPPVVGGAPAPDTAATPAVVGAPAPDTPATPADVGAPPADVGAPAPATPGVVVSGPPASGLSLSDQAALAKNAQEIQALHAERLKVRAAQKKASELEAYHLRKALFKDSMQSEKASALLAAVSAATEATAAEKAAAAAKVALDEKMAHAAFEQEAAAAHAAAAANAATPAKRKSKQSKRKLSGEKVPPKRRRSARKKKVVEEVVEVVEVHSDDEGSPVDKMEWGVYESDDDATDADWQVPQQWETKQYYLQGHVGIVEFERRTKTVAFLLYELLQYTPDAKTGVQASITPPQLCG